MNGVLIFAIILFVLIIGIGAYYYISTNDDTLPDDGTGGSGGGSLPPPKPLDSNVAITQYLIAPTTCPRTYPFIQDTSQDIAKGCGGEFVYPCYLNDTPDDPSHRLTDVLILNGPNPKCPTGYDLDPTDFNKGCGGDTVTACYKYEKDPSEYINDIQIRRECVQGYDVALSSWINKDGSLQTASTKWSNLKAGTGAKTPNLFMCLHKQKKSS